METKYKTMIWIAAIVLLGAFAYSFLKIDSKIVSGNTSTLENGQQQGVAVGEPNPNIPSQKVDGTMCTMEYAPVCGVDGITYGNDCMAQTTEIAYQGECLVADPQARCSREYIPVCGIDNETYSNLCMAERLNGVKVAYDGECNSDNSSAAGGTFLVNSEQDTSNMTAEELAVA